MYVVIATYCSCQIQHAIRRSEPVRAGAQFASPDVSGDCMPLPHVMGILQRVAFTRFSDLNNEMMLDIVPNDTQKPRAAKLSAPRRK